MLQLEVIEATGRRAVALDKSPFHIGRSSESQLQISDTQASRRHAELRVQRPTAGMFVTAGRVSARFSTIRKSRTR